MSEFDNPYATDDFGTDIGMLFPSSRSKALDMIVNMFLENNTIDAYSDVNQIVEQVVANVIYLKKISVLYAGIFFFTPNPNFFLQIFSFTNY